MSAASLQAALAALGIGCDVEAHDGLAVLVPRDDAGERLRDPAARRAALAILGEHGFTHLALELETGEPAGRAPVPRD